MGARPSRDSPSITDEVRTRLFSAYGRPNPTKKPFTLDDRKCNDLSSNESLSYATNRMSRSVHINEQKGDIQHVLSTNRTHNFKNDRVVLLANKVPFYMFSNIPFNKDTQNIGRLVSTLLIYHIHLKFIGLAKINRIHLNCLVLS